MDLEEAYKRGEVSSSLHDIRKYMLSVGMIILTLVILLTKIQKFLHCKVTIFSFISSSQREENEPPLLGDRNTK